MYRRARAALPGANVVFDGDSRTIGTGGQGPYPLYVAQELTALHMLEWHNFGVAGQTVADMSADAATQIDPLRRPDMPNILVMLGGYNDWTAGGQTAATILARIWAYCDARRAAGWTMLICTEMPASDNSWQTPRDTIVTTMRSDYASHADGLIDLAADPVMGPWAARDDTTLYLDRTHPTSLGYRSYAAVVTAAIRARIG